MKFRLTFKTPDALNNCDVYNSLKEDEQEAIEKNDMDTAMSLLDQIENMENTVEQYTGLTDHITIEFDTDGMQAKVVKARA